MDMIHVSGFEFVHMKTFRVCNLIDDFTHIGFDFRGNDFSSVFDRHCIYYTTHSEDYPGRMALSSRPLNDRGFPLSILKTPELEILGILIYVFSA